MVALLVFKLLHPVRMQRYAGSFFFFFFSCVHKSMWAQPTVFLQSQNLHFFSFILAIGFVFFFFPQVR